YIPLRNLRTIDCDCPHSYCQRVEDHPIDDAWDIQLRVRRSRAVCRDEGTERGGLIDAGEYSRSGGYADSCSRGNIYRNDDWQVGTVCGIEQRPNFCAARVSGVVVCADECEGCAVVGNSGDGGRSAICDVHRNADEQYSVRRGRSCVIKGECLRARPAEICRGIR